MKVEKLLWVAHNTRALCQTRKWLSAEDEDREVDREGGDAQPVVFTNKHTQQRAVLVWEKSAQESMLVDGMFPIVSLSVSVSLAHRWRCEHMGYCGARSHWRE